VTIATWLAELVMGMGVWLQRGYQGAEATLGGGLGAAAGTLGEGLGAASVGIGVGQKMQPSKPKGHAEGWPCCWSKQSSIRLVMVRPSRSYCWGARSCSWHPQRWARVFIRVGQARDWGGNKAFAKMPASWWMALSWEVSSMVK
jgi:hypothetical protein